MSAEEAAMFVDYGRRWHRSVWGAQKDDARTNRTQILTALNAALNQHGISFRAAVWQEYEHIVHVADTPLRYSGLVALAAGQPDGGRGYATALRNWYSTNGANGLLDLPRPMQALGVITHFSEVARGYEVALRNELYPWMDDIIAAANPAVVWTDFARRFSPALTYAQDRAAEYANQ